MEERSVTVHDAAAVAVDAWTNAALQSLVKTEPQPQQQLPADVSSEVHDLAVGFTEACVSRGVTHATATTYSEAWIREGLAHSISGTTLLPIHTDATGIDDPKDSQETTTSDPQQYEVLEAIRSKASAVATHTVQCALDQVMAVLVTTQEVPIEASEDTSAPLSPRVVEAPSTTSSEAAPTPTVDIAVDEPQPASTDVVDDSPALVQDQEAMLHDVRAAAATRFVSSLLDDAVIRRQLNTSPSSPFPHEAQETTAPPVVRTPTPPPEPKPAAVRPHVEVAIPRPQSHEEDPRIASPRLPTPDPPVELAAVRPPKTGSHSRSKKPSPAQVASPPPKTAESHSKHKGHRGSPAKAAGEEEDPPPRLRKLEEYLALHPVDRAKKIYRPQQQPARGQLPSLQAPHTPSGYDAETDDSDDDDEEPQMLHLKPRSLKKLRPPPKFPAASSPPKARPPPVLKPVDRPERLGLLNKPKKRSGFCQQCTFEGRSCKIIDCLKHQPLR